MPPSLIINWWIHPSCTVSSCLWNLQILHYLCFFIYNFNLIRRESDGIGLKLIPDYVHLKSFRIVAWISVANLSSLWCISNWYRLHLCWFLNMMCFWGLSDIWLGFKHLFFYVYDAFLNYNIYYICACSWLWRGSGLISAAPVAGVRQAEGRARGQGWDSGGGEAGSSWVLLKGTVVFGETNVINDLGRVLRSRKLGTYFWSHQKLVSYYRSILLAVRSSGVIVSYVCVEACAFWSLHWGLGCHDL